MLFQVNPDTSDSDYTESLVPTWSEISVAFKETDSIKTHFNPENELELVSNYAGTDDRIVVSDGELSIIEEVSEPDSATNLLASRSLESDGESLYDNNRLISNKPINRKTFKRVTPHDIASTKVRNTECNELPNSRNTECNERPNYIEPSKTECDEKEILSEINNSNDYTSLLITSRDDISSILSSDQPITDYNSSSEHTVMSKDSIEHLPTRENVPSLALSITSSKLPTDNNSSCAVSNNDSPDKKYIISPNSLGKHIQTTEKEISILEVLVNTDSSSSEQAECDIDSLLNTSRSEVNSLQKASDSSSSSESSESSSSSSSSNSSNIIDTHLNPPTDELHVDDPANQSSLKRYTITESQTDDKRNPSTGHTYTISDYEDSSSLDQNHNTTFTVNSYHDSEGNECKDSSDKSDIINLSNSTYLVLPIDEDSPNQKKNCEQANTDSKTHSVSSHSSASTPLNSDSNSVMDDSLIESVQMSSMKLSGIIASQVSELSNQLSSIVFSCDSDNEAAQLPEDDDGNLEITKNDQKQSNSESNVTDLPPDYESANLSSEMKNREISSKTIVNDPNHSEEEEEETNKTIKKESTRDPKVETLDSKEQDTSKAAVELTRDSVNTVYASAEQDTSKGVTDLTEDSSNTKSLKKESILSKEIKSWKSFDSPTSLEKNKEKTKIDIPAKISVAQRISEFENQKGERRKLRACKSLPVESIVNKYELGDTSLSNGYHSSGNESVFSDDIFSCSLITSKNRRTLNNDTKENIDKNITELVPLKDSNKRLLMSSSDSKIGFMDAAKFKSSQNELSNRETEVNNIEAELNSTKLSEHFMSNGVSESSGDESRKLSSDEEVQLELFSVLRDNITNGISLPTNNNNYNNNNNNNRNNSMNGSSVLKHNDDSQAISLRNDNVISQSPLSMDNTIILKESSVDEFVIEDLNLDQSKTILYNLSQNDESNHLIDGEDSPPLDEDSDGPLIINKPIKNLYCFGGNIDISSSESQEVSDINDVSDVNDLSDTHDVSDRNASAELNEVSDPEQDDFNVTQINDLEESTVSRISTVASDSEKLNKSRENVNEDLDKIEEHANGDLLFQCSSPVDSQADIDANHIFECSLPVEYKKEQKEYDERSFPDDTQKCRVFVANFSYDPLTMSPNVELIDDELAFFDGDLIKVYGEIGNDGFYFGELNGKRGYLPGNMVTEIDPSDYKTTEALNNGDSFFDLSTGNRKMTTNEPSTEDVHPSNPEPSASANLNEESAHSSNNNSVTKLRDHVSAKRVINSKSSSTNNISRDSEEGAYSVDPQPKSSSMPNVSSDYFDKLEYDIDEDLYDPPNPYLLKPTMMIALFPYDPATSSPNVDAEV